MKIAIPFLARHLTIASGARLLTPNVAKVEDAARRSRYRGDPRRHLVVTTVQVEWEFLLSMAAEDF